MFGYKIINEKDLKHLIDKVFNLQKENKKLKSQLVQAQKNDYRDSQGRFAKRPK